MNTVDPALQPVTLGGLEVIHYFTRFFGNQIRCARAISRRHGNFVFLRNPVALAGLPRSVVFAADASLYREILGQPHIWRTVNIATATPKNHASRRLTKGIVSMQGKRHAHYRRLLIPPLRRANVMERSADMGRVADRATDRWPVDQFVDLFALVRRLMQDFATTLLFGDDQELGPPIADLIVQAARASFSLPINAFPLDAAGTPYSKFLRNSEILEAKILEWADTKRGEIDAHDLLSIVVNNRDENGNPPSDELLSGHVPTLFGAAYETCQNALIWSLILIAQHPGVAGDLFDELRGGLNDGPVTLSAVTQLPLLDAVVKESLRILPPVPSQFRVALEDTTLAGHPVEKRTRVLLSAFITNRTPHLYHDADRFLPERWQAINPSQFEYPVFSAGPRSCPGFYFGTSMIKVALAAILSRYRIELPSGARINYKVAITLRPHPLVPARLHPQDGTFSAVPLAGMINELVRLPVHHM